MKTRVSKRGDIVVPGSIAKQLGLRPGDSLEISVNAIRIAISPIKKRSRRKAQIVIDEITGSPVLTLGAGASKLTSRQVKDMLADFP